MDNNFENYENEEFQVITLDDENGNPVNFEFLDIIEYEGKEYIYLMPLDEDDGSVVILGITEFDEENDQYEGIEDEDLLAVLFEKFKEKNAEYFDFAE